MLKKSKSLVIEEKEIVRASKSQYHETRRLARVYSGVHDIQYNDLVAIALKQYINPEQLKKDVIKYLKDRGLPISYSKGFIEEIGTV